MRMYEVLNYMQFYERIKDIKMPLKVAYKFSKIAKALEVEQEFYSSKLSEIINNFSQKEDNGELKYSDDASSVLIISGKEKECNEAINQLNSLEVRIPDISFSLDELALLDETEFSAGEISALIPFIDN